MPLDGTTFNSPLDRSVEILERARDGLLESWGRGVWRQKKCAVDWVIWAAHDVSLGREVLRRWVYPELPRRWRRLRQTEMVTLIAVFNDMPWRRRARMVKLLEAAIEKASAERDALVTFR